MEHQTHWTDVIANVVADYWFIFAIALGVGVLALAVRRVLHDRPHAGTSAMDRLIERNPAILFDDARWTVTARRVRTGWVTSVAVATALLIAADRPTQPGAN